MTIFLFNIFKELYNKLLFYCCLMQTVFILTCNNTESIVAFNILSTFEIIEHSIINYERIEF